MSVISSDPLRGKKPISQELIKKLIIDGGHTKISEKIQAKEDFSRDALSATVAINITNDGRCGQSELVNLGGPLSGSIKASKVWQNCPEDLELTVLIEDTNALRCQRGLLSTRWYDSKDNRISYKWSQHANEDDDALDDNDTETDISCTGFSIRLNFRPKTASELRVDMLLVPVKAESLTEEAYQNFEHPRFPAFRMGKKGGEVVKLLNQEEGPDFFGIGVWPWLIDLRPNATSFPESSDIKLAVACLLRSAVDPAVKEKRETWNPASTTHTATSKKPSFIWPRPTREAPLPESMTPPRNMNRAGELNLD